MERPSSKWSYSPHKTLSLTAMNFELGLETSLLNKGPPSNNSMKQGNKQHLLLVIFWIVWLSTSKYINFATYYFYAFGSQVNTDNIPSHFYHLYKYPVTWFMYSVVRRSLASKEMTESTTYHRPISIFQVPLRKNKRSF